MLKGLASQNLIEIERFCNHEILTWLQIQKCLSFALFSSRIKTLDESLFLWKDIFMFWCQSTKTILQHLPFLDASSWVNNSKSKIRQALMSNSKKDWIYLFVAKNRIFWEQNLRSKKHFGPRKFGSKKGQKRKKNLSSEKSFS